MAPEKGRHAEVGDLIIQKHPRTGEQWLGLVHNITRNKWDHETVFIHWMADTPPNYQEKHGLSSMNIHNLRPEFDVVKA